MSLPASLRRLGTVGVAAAAVLTAAAIVPAAAHADDSSTVSVIGTSDVSDSFLVQSVIKPGFERANPDLTLNYTGKGSQQAITLAETGAYSAMIVHAASLENQFVDSGYSTEKYGRAVFYGDFILAGQKSDGAGVLTDGATSHDIVAAYEKIATAGAAGDATFVSRNTGSGTDVAEHQIWARTTGVDVCKVSTANGGGAIPIKDPSTEDSAGNCPSSLVTPDWYKSTGTTQGPNVQAADTCSSSSFPNGNCYVFTDRGTFQYLQSQKLLTTLVTVVRDNDAAAPGGTTILTNSFHAYAINPDRFAGNSNVHINSAGARAFLDYLTSPSTQAAIGNYLNDRTNGAPFLPDAAPTVTATQPSPASVFGRQTITVTGSLTNVVPGTPALANQQVTLRAVPTVDTAAEYTAATATTNANGDYTLKYSPVGSARYYVATGTLTQIENASLSPNFGDILQPAAGALSNPVAVQSGVTFTKLTGGTGQISGTVALSPNSAYQDGQLQLYTAPYPSKSPTLRYVASVPVAPGQSTAAFRFYLPKGGYYTQLRYVNSGVIKLSGTHAYAVTVH